MATLGLEIGNHFRGESPFGFEAEPRWCVEMTVKMERGNIFRNVGEVRH